TLAGADGTLDPTQGVTLSLAAPKDGQMMIAERTLTMHGSAKHASGHDGGLSLVLRRKGDGFSFTAKGKRADVPLLNTGNRGLAVAVEVAKTGDFPQAQFVQNRNLAGKKNVLTLPKNKKKKGHKA